MYVCANDIVYDSECMYRVVFDYESAFDHKNKHAHQTYTHTSKKKKKIATLDYFSFTENIFV